MNPLCLSSRERIVNETRDFLFKQTTIKIHFLILTGSLEPLPFAQLQETAPNQLVHPAGAVHNWLSYQQGPGQEQEEGGSSACFDHIHCPDVTILFNAYYSVSTPTKVTVTNPLQIEQYNI